MTLCLVASSQIELSSPIPSFKSTALVIICVYMTVFVFYQEKIAKLFERKVYEDFDTNSHIQKKKEFRNPRFGAQLRISITFTI